MGDLLDPDPHYRRPPGSPHDISKIDLRWSVEGVRPSQIFCPAPSKTPALDSSELTTSSG